MYTVVPGCLPRLTSRALWFANGGRNRRLLRAYAAASAQQAPRSRSPPQRQRPPQQHDSSSGALKGAGATKRSFPSPLQQRRQAPARADYFYAESASSFEQLGITPAVAAALKAAGYARPSRVQELAAPPLLAGRDLVLAAETGSGKTLAYLAPIATALLRHQELEAAAAAGTTSADAPSSRPADARDAAIAAARADARRPLALVLVPNTALCQQVLSMADALRGADGAPLLRACTVSSRCPPPFERPDVVVTTPGALCTLLREVEGYGQLWTPEGLADSVRHLVVDEADLLLTGGYERDLNRILDLMKVSERRQMEEAAAQQLRVSPELIRGLSRPLKLALWDRGVRGLLSAGWRRPGASRSSSGSGSSGADDVIGADGVDAAAALRKRYAFVAATMPALSKEDAGSELQRRYKAAAWVSGDLLHRSKPAVAHKWVEVEGERAWAEALMQAVTGCEDYAAGRARVLVFARDVNSADSVSELLHQEGVCHHVYHKSVSQEDREAALQAMAAAARTDRSSSDSGSSNGSGSSGNVVVVSTDAAARGIDLPDVTHVVQADFATNAVDFIHRIGRTARADRGGKVTSLVLPEASVLAAALRAYVEEGKPVEGCFSRNRSFSRKVKRYGGFVPRGEVGAQRGPAAGGDV